MRRMDFVIVTVLFLSSVARAAPPKTLQEGLDRLEAIFGKYDSKNTRLFRFETKLDRNIPAADDATSNVHALSDSVTILSNPYLSEGKLALDSSLLTDWSQRISSKTGQELSKNASQSYALERFLFRPALTGDWVYESKNSGHSMPEYRDTLNESGSVVWLDNGIRLESTSGLVEFIWSEKPILAVQRYTRTFTVKDAGGERTLESTIKAQTYHPVRTAEGVALAIPDFGRPAGELIEIKEESLPWGSVGVKAQK